MEDLVRHLIHPIVTDTDAVEMRSQQGDNVLLVELKVAEADKATVDGEKGRTIRAIRTLMSASAGRSKVSLDLVDEFTIEESEEAASEESDAADADAPETEEPAASEAADSEESDEA